MTRPPPSGLKTERTEKTGPMARDGANGVAGQNGANGTNGTNGAAGQTEPMVQMEPPMLWHKKMKRPRMYWKAIPFMAWKMVELIKTGDLVLLLSGGKQVRAGHVNEDGALEVGSEQIARVEKP